MKNTQKKKLCTRKKLALLFLLFSLLILSSCAASNIKSSNSYDAAVSESAELSPNVAMGGYKDFDEVAEESLTNSSEDIDNSNIDAYDKRKIIYSSWYDINTEEYDNSITALDALCKKYNAYYESSESYGGGNSRSNRSANFVVRIPIENYFNFISETGNIGTVVRSGENNKDITENYFDTEARLASAKLREERLLEILSKSAKLSDVLLLEQELSDVRYEIESYSGTLRKYDSLINYSTSEINIREVLKVVIPDSEKLSLKERMTNALEQGFDNFKGELDDFLVGLSFSLPTILLVQLPVLIILITIFTLVRRRLKKRKSETKIQKENKANEK